MFLRLVLMMLAASLPACHQSPLASLVAQLEASYDPVEPKMQQFAMSCGPSTVMNLAKLCPALPNFEGPGARKTVLDMFYEAYSRSAIGHLHSRLFGKNPEARRWLYEKVPGEWVKDDQFVGSIVYDLKAVLSKILADQGFEHPEEYLTCQAPDPQLLMDIATKSGRSKRKVLGVVQKLLFRRLDLQQAMDRLETIVGREGQLMAVTMDWMSTTPKPEGHWVLAAPYAALPDSMKERFEDGDVIIFDSANPKPEEMDGVKYDTMVKRGAYLATDEAQAEQLKDRGLRLVSDTEVAVQPEKLYDYISRMKPYDYQKSWAFGETYCALKCPMQARSKAKPKKKGGSCAVQ